LKNQPILLSELNLINTVADYRLLFICYASMPC